MLRMHTRPLIFSALARRGLATATSRPATLTVPPLTASPQIEKLKPLTEASHFKGPPHPHPSHDQNPHTTGDWVLFHPVYTVEENQAVKVLTRPAVTISDKAASTFSKILRWGFDLVSGYKHKEIPKRSKMTFEELRKGGYIMTEAQWLSRILFLESIAGVPGMVAATARHLRSLRLMQRDAGWIHTLLQEAENERMHLMTFMTLKQPGIMFRTMILGAQGVFYNTFFLAYLFNPKAAHRFVACLEEEAVVTYTRLIEALHAGHLPAWQDHPAPGIAVDYWRLPANAKLLDVIYAVRSDESTHRFVNHSLANLEPQDINPFALGEPDMHIKGTKTGFERGEAAAYVRSNQPTRPA